MRGHEQLIAMRMRGLLPPYGVAIETDAQPSRWPMLWAASPYEPCMAHVHIGPSERLGGLDLRYLVGLEVKVDGQDAERVRAVFEACLRAKAQRVIGVVFTRRGENCTTQQMMDSKGEANWQAS